MVWKWCAVGGGAWGKVCFHVQQNELYLLGRDSPVLTVAHPPGECYKMRPEGACKGGWRQAWRKWW